MWKWYRFSKVATTFLTTQCAICLVFRSWVSCACKKRRRPLCKKRRRPLLFTRWINLLVLIIFLPPVKPIRRSTQDHFRLVFLNHRAVLAIIHACSSYCSSWHNNQGHHRWFVASWIISTNLLSEFVEQAQWRSQPKNLGGQNVLF